MTVSQSFPTAWTPTCSTRGRNIPILSFFGRPGDPRKGLVTFFDALVILQRLTHVPPFVVWVVGGSDDEIGLIDELGGARPALRALRQRGAITIWGRVAVESLPELYSRSSVTVMPSWREQFGIVAIEAMSCGSPVIAARIGGLADTVLGGYTGTHFDVDDPSGLANAILGYLRNPERVHREGCNAIKWARLAFSNDVNYPRFNRIYTGQGRPAGFPDRAWLRQVDLEELQNAVATHLGEPVTVEDVSSSDHTSAIVTAASGESFCKWYRPERAAHITVLPVPPELRHERTLAYYSDRLLFHAGNPFVPGVARLPDAAQPFALFERCRAAVDIDIDKEVRTIAAGFRAYRPFDPADPAGREYLAALATALSARTLESIERHDLAAARLNQRLSNGRPRFQQVHPHIELLRMKLLLRSDAWAIPPEVTERFAGAMDFVLDHSHIPLKLPEVCHGTLKIEHLLRNSADAIVACDTDSSRYIVGPFDEVHNVFVEVTESPSFGIASALARLSALTDSFEDRSIAASWLLVYLIFDALLTATMGGDIRQTRAFRICRDLPYAWRRAITRSR
jgi:Glycosyl transferases group 1